MTILPSKSLSLKVFTLLFKINPKLMSGTLSPTLNRDIFLSWANEYKFSRKIMKTVIVVFIYLSWILNQVCQAQYIRWNRPGIFQVIRGKGVYRTIHSSAQRSCKTRVDVQSSEVRPTCVSKKQLFSPLIQNQTKQLFRCG